MLTLSFRPARARLLKHWNDLTSSYWFVPSLMALAAVVLSIVMVLADISVGASLVDEIPWLYVNRPEGARSVLSTIAGSMITVAGVTFSITIASVVYASSQYGPRIMGNFMRNRGNQVTLGTFIATFLYCLLVLRTVRSAEENGDGVFVPHLSVLVGILLALSSVGVLIYFIHHVPATIHLPHVVADIGQELRHQIEHIYPEDVGQPLPGGQRAEAELPERFLEEAAPVPAGGTGYVQAVDGDRLVGLAREYDAVLRVEYRPGNFVTQGNALVLAWPPDRATEDLSESIRNAFALGRQRNHIQDVLFPIDELVEIAARALSPGVNDPFTAINCLDWLSSGLVCIAGRSIPKANRYDGEGKLRVITYPVTLADATDAVFGQLAPYFAPDRNAALHMMKVIAGLAEDLSATEARQALLRYAEALNHAAQKALLLDHDRREMERRYKVIAHQLRSQAERVEIDDENRWIRGGA